MEQSIKPQDRNCLLNAEPLAAAKSDKQRLQKGTNCLQNMLYTPLALFGTAVMTMRKNCLLIVTKTHLHWLKNID